MDAPNFVENMAAAMVDAGMPRMASRVFAAVLASPEGELSPAEIAEELQVSAGAVSGAAGYLMQAGMIRRRLVPGSRRTVIGLTGDIWYEAVATRSTVMQRWLAVAEEGLDELPPGGPAAARVEVMRDFYAFVIEELPRLLDRWREHRVRTHGF